MSHTSALAWIRFLRLPAVLTVPGDVLVGATLVSRQASVHEVISVCAAYLFGMALNDLVDFSADCQNRPDRPLPKGQIAKPKAMGTCGLLAMLAFFANPGLPLVALLLLISAYTVLKNKNLFSGIWLMALCRGMALWIGAGSPSQPSNPLLMGIGLWMALIAWITFLADNENKENPNIKVQSFGLTLLWLCAPILGLTLSPKSSFLSFVPWVLLFWLGTQNFQSIKKLGLVTPQNTGTWLSMLIPLQSCFLFLFGQELSGIGVFLLYPCLKWAILKIQIS